MGYGRTAPRRWSRRLAWALLVACGIALDGAALAGDDPPPAGPAPNQPILGGDAGDPLTSLETGPLARSDAVVLGDVHVVLRGTSGAPTLVRVDIAKVLKGDAGGASLNLFLAGEKPTNQASAPARPFFASSSPGTFVLFLKKSPAGSGFTLEALFDAQGEMGQEKESVLEKEISIAAVKDPEARRRRLLSHFLDLLGKESPWSRMHAARELDIVAATAPRVFDDGALREMDAARNRAVESGLRAFLTDAIRRVSPDWTPKSLEPAARGTTAGSPPPASIDLEALRRRLREADGDEARVTALTALAKAGKEAAVPDLVTAYADKSAAFRERAAALLGDVRARSALPTLLAPFDAEKDAGVREAVVRAVGLTGSDPDVAWLVARTSEPSLERAVLFALARIRTPGALVALGKERERLLSLPAPERGTARLIDYLRGASFVEAERAAGRSIGLEGGAVEAGGERR